MYSIKTHCSVHNSAQKPKFDLWVIVLLGFLNSPYDRINVYPHSGPVDHTKFIKVSDDDAGDGTNAKIVCKLSPDRDYYLQI